MRGRLVVAETGDAIHAAFPVRLRTLDLALEEDLFTLPDGTFTSASAFPSGVLLARVNDGDGRELVDHEARFEADAMEEWLVQVPARAYPTFARGVVVDRRGDPFEEVRVQLVPLALGLPYVEASSDEDGEFELANLRAGSYRLVLQALWSKSEPLDLVLSAGANELGPLVAPGGRNGGLLVSFVALEDGDCPDALVVVRPASIPIELPFHVYAGESRRGGRFELPLARLPEGECAVTLESLDGRRYEPEHQTVSIPGGLEVRVSGTSRPRPRMRVREAGSENPVLAFELWNRWHGIWHISSIRDTQHFRSGGELELNGRGPFVLLAKGYRGRRGSSEGSGEVIELELERGWSRLYVFEDGEGDSFSNPDFGLRRALLAGVEVLADGELAGVSDADGIVLLADEAEPARVEFRLAGWRCLDERQSGSLRFVRMMRSP